MKERGFSKVSIIFLIIIISIVSVSATQQGAKVGDACRATLGKFEGEIGVVDNMWDGGFRVSSPIFQTQQFREFAIETNN